MKYFHNNNELSVLFRVTSNFHGHTGADNNKISCRTIPITLLHCDISTPNIGGCAKTSIFPLFYHLVQFSPRNRRFLFYSKINDSMSEFFLCAFKIEKKKKSLNRWIRWR